MSNDALFPLPPVAEADPALVMAEPAAPTDPADTVSDSAVETTPATPESSETTATVTTTDEATTADGDTTPTDPSIDPVTDETAALSPEGEIAIEELPPTSEPVEAEVAESPAPSAEPTPETPSDSTETASESMETPSESETPAESEAPADGAAPAEATTAPSGSVPSGVDPALISARMTEIVVELESIAASQDVDDAGKHPDDRALTERVRTLEEVWRTLITSGVQEPELRARQAAARAAYAGSRSRRAEMRAVDRARSGETKRALLVEAFALAQLAQGTSLSQLAGRRVGDEETVAEKAQAEPAAAEPAAEETPEAEAPESTATTATEPEATEPTEPIAEDVVAADVTLADTELPTAVADAEDAAIEPVDATLADDTVADVAADESVADVAADDTVADAGPEVVAVPDEVVDTAADEVPEVAVADGPTTPEPEVAPEPAPAPVSSTVTIDISAIARRARELQAEWTAAGFAGREVENELQPLFRRYMQVVFDLSRKESSVKSDARRALVTAARELADQAGDDVTNDAISRLVRDAKNLQTQWKNGEAAPPAVESGAWRQFSGALRQVFAARERLSAGAKAEREAIIASVTALAAAKEPMRAMRDLGPLLRRWRESGPVTTPVYEALKLQLDRAAATVRERADVERKRRDAEDEKSQGERAKNASKILREAERSGRGKRQERPAAQAQAQGALAAALAEAFGRAERVAEDVRDLERTVADVRARLALAESGSLESTTEEVENEQGFTVRRQTIDPGSVNPARLRAELAQAEQALGRRQAELRELTSNARGFGLS